MEWPVRVLQIPGKMQMGGVETTLMHYYRHIDRTRIQFDFAVDADSDFPQREEIEQMGGKIYLVAPYQNTVSYLRDIYHIVSLGKYEIVHAHMNTLNVLPLSAAKCAGARVRICHNHSSAGKGEFKKNLMKYTLRPLAKLFPTDLFACSRYAAEWLYGRREVTQGHVHVLTTAIETGRFTFSKEMRDEARERLGVAGRFVIGHVGRFIHQKNHAFLLRIFAAVRAQEKDAVLLLIGNGPLEEACRAQARSLGIENAVIFAGVQQEIERVYQAMDVFVLPSFYEGLPAVAYEAQAAGLPCICSDTMTHETQITDRVEFLSLARCVQEWAARILIYRTAERDTEGVQALFDAGCDIEIVTRRLQAFYLKQCAAAEGESE